MVWTRKGQYIDDNLVASHSEKFISKCLTRLLKKNTVMATPTTHCHRYLHSK